MALRWPMRSGQLFVLALALWGFISPGLVARAEATNYLVNGDFSEGTTGWSGIDGGENCQGGKPSTNPWGNNDLVFSHVASSVSQDVVIPLPGQVTLSFTGELGQAGGHYQATLVDGDQSISTGPLVNEEVSQASLTITTESNDEIVTVSFTGIDELWWAGCYGPIISNASLTAESLPEETTTTTTETPQEYYAPISGLDYWSYDSSGTGPQLPPNGAQLSQGHIDGLQYDWGGGEVLDSGRYDNVIIKFIGWLSPPESKTYYLCAFTDDGFRLYLDDALVINDWWDRGPSCGGTADVDFADGQPKLIEAYFYENGGGAVAELRYYTDSGTWATVPNSWYSDGNTSEPPSTSTTTIPVSLGAPTAVTITQSTQGVLVDWEAATDDVGISPERYSIQWSLNGSGWGIATGNVGDENALNTEILLGYELFESTGGLGQTYEFTVRADNDTNGLVSPISNTVSATIVSQTPETTTLPPETTTLPPETTAPPATTTNPPTTAAPPPPIIDNNDGDGNSNDNNPDSGEQPVDGTTPSSTPESEIPEPTPGGEDEETQTETPVDPAPGEPIEDNSTPVDTAPDGTAPDEPSSDQPEDEDAPLVDDLETMTPEEIVAEVDSAIEEGLSPSEALMLASSAAVLAALEKDQAQEVFASLDINALDDSQIAEIVDAVQDAPDEVRASFEEEIDIFGSGGAVDNYVPLGSTVTVAQRRALIAVSAVFATLAAAPVASASSNSKRGR